MAISIPPVIVLLVANFWYFNRDYKYYKPSLKFVERKMFKDIFSLGVKFFIVQLAGLIMFASSNIILTQVVNPSEVSLYNISRQYFNIPFMVFGIILMPFWSAITDAYTRQEFHWIKQAMKKLFYLGLLFSLGVTIMLLISPFAYKIWLGDAIHIPFKLSVVTAIMFIFYIMFAPFSHFINGVGKLSLGIRIGVVKMLLFLPVAILLTNYLSAVGLVLAMILVNAIPTALLEPLQYKKIINKQAKGIWNQ
jgi:O-antigen/teichoic acid export membrane protein